ncbi:hypothetical protein FHS21_004076 [Phyllobacterium trifolii]|uniref:Uncharacterized protein n=1 Tax=Phyllobacterium trifolii TaxID=300193 RepID=A0A839UFP7_9HYPH|nr:hypothetical protein [Phyllobacterium trifolii]
MVGWQRVSALHRSIQSVRLWSDKGDALGYYAKD